MNRLFFKQLVGALAFFSGLGVPPSFGEKVAIECDVLVYGSTPAGYCAAIGAARAGASVLLLEPTRHVGGVNTGGLAFSDSNQTLRSAMGGLFEEWHLRIERDYWERGIKLPYDPRVKDHSYWTYEPHVAMRVTQAMIAEAGVELRVNDPFRTLHKNGTRIVGIETESGSAFRAAVFVDATYEGDLMAAAGVSWTIGREGVNEFNESFAGRRYVKPPMALSGFDAAGELLPLLTSRVPGEESVGDENVMVYSYRLTLTKEIENYVPFPEPRRYDPDRFEIMRRYFATTGDTKLPWDLYPIPGNKVDANNGIHKQFSMGLVGAGNGWCSADLEGRERMSEDYRQYTMEMYRFLTTDPGVPQSIREELSAYGLCRDEFIDTGHWTPQLYVREGRRMRGQYVFTQHDVMKDLKKPDSIGINSFPIDSHDCRRVAFPDGTVMNEGTIFPRETKEAGQRRGPVAQVPYRSILPIPEECENLLVPVALSATHVAYSSVRVEPTWMVLGQSAGVAAALASQQDVSVQKLPYESLRIELLVQGQVLEVK